MRIFPPIRLIFSYNQVWQFRTRFSESTWCNVVQVSGPHPMAQKPKSEPSTRMSVTLSADTHASLEIIAKQKKVSLAWVMRDAAEKYVADQWPLFAGKKHE
jgi:hypothetical protein